jgi:NAD-dependent DNA ligase
LLTLLLKIVSAVLSRGDGEIGEDITKAALVFIAETDLPRWIDWLVDK